MGLEIDAKRYIEMAQKENKELQVNEEDLLALMNMDFGFREAQRALRACAGNRDVAIDYALNKRSLREAEKAKEYKKYLEKKQKKKYGKTVSGHWIEISLMNSLSQMGFEQDIVVEALRQTDNNESECVIILTDPDRISMLQMAVEERKQNQLEELLGSASTSSTSTSSSSSSSLSTSALSKKKLQPNPMLLTDLISMGFDPENARLALIISNNSLEDAISTATNDLEVLKLFKFRRKQNI